MRQIALQMLKRPYRYYPYIEQELLDVGESYESYCVNIFESKVWGDDLMAGVLGDMWNLPISLVSPVFTQPLNLFHNTEPLVVIVANGGSYMSEGKSCTHFSSSRVLDKEFRLPGFNLIGSPSLMPTILDDKVVARKLALQEYKKVEEGRSLKLLKGLSSSIMTLDNKICELVKQADELIEQKNVLEFKMEKLGISVDKIREAGDIGERGFVRTADRERVDREIERKRKFEEEEKEKEKESKKRKVISVDDEGNEVEEVPTDGGYKEKLKIQQEQIELQQKLIQSQILLQNERLSKPEPVAEPSTSTAGQYNIQNLLSANALKFLKVEKTDGESKQVEGGVIEIHEDEIVATEVIQPGVPIDANVIIEQPDQSQQSEAATASNKVFIPAVTHDKQNIVLLEATPRKSTSLRTDQSGPVPTAMQVAGKFYCKNCRARYTRIDELRRHVKFNCLKTEFEFYCVECSKGFYSTPTVREHYYRDHLKEFLYFCKKCGEGFHYKSRRSGHKNACPQKEQPDKYEPRAPWDEDLEKTFKRRVPVVLDEAVLAAAEEEMGDSPCIPPKDSEATPPQLPEAAPPQLPEAATPQLPATTEAEQVDPSVVNPSTDEDTSASKLLEDLGKEDVINIQ